MTQKKGRKNLNFIMVTPKPFNKMFNTSVARQPNDLLCIVDHENNKLVQYNMTEEEYIQYRINQVREKAIDEIKNLDPLSFRLVDCIFVTDDEDDAMEGIEKLREMGDYKTQFKDIYTGY